MNERQRVDGLSTWYLEQQLDFDRRLIGFRYRSLRPHLRGPRGLELGPAEGLMTRLLLPHFERLTVVDGSLELLERIPPAPTLVKVHALFEELALPEPADTVILEHVLEHVADPVGLLRRARSFLAPGGRMILGVPNGHSLHRLVGVKMGLLEDPCALNERDHALGHRRVYTPASVERDVSAAGLRLRERWGVFLKPLSNRQMEEQWDEALIEGFYELGKDFPDHACEIQCLCDAPA